MTVLQNSRFRNPRHLRWSKITSINAVLQFAGEDRSAERRRHRLHSQEFQVRTIELLEGARRRAKDSVAQGIADAVKPFALQLGRGVTLMLFAAPLLGAACASAQDLRHLTSGSISGTVLDGEGIPQVGALVQLILPDTRLAATTLTDAHGRYRLPDVMPGAYRVRVSAALFLPVVRQHLVIAGNTRAVVNMTLSTMLYTTDWLPATRRSGAAGDEDWMWTLRASTMRPVLRLTEDDNTEGSSPTAISSSAEQPRSIGTMGRITVQESEGGFARGGTHNVISMVRRSGDTVSVVRADLSGPRTPFPVNSSAELTFGTEHKLPFAGTSRSVLTYTSHPEVQGSNGSAGLQTAVLRNAQRMELGDRVRFDAGTVTRDVSLGGNTFSVEPFLKVSLHPSHGVVIAYTFTASRGTESLEDLDQIHPPPPSAFSQNGHVQVERGSHQSVGLSTQLPNSGVFQVAVYRDHMDSAALAGIGLLSSADASTVSSVTDPTTATFLAAAHAYGATGIRLAAMQPVTKSFAITGAFADGEALVAASPHDAMLSTLIAGLVSRNTIAASVGANGRFQRSGTALNAGYRWQSEESLTAVDRYAAADDTAYLHAQLRQSLRSCPMLPAGLEAVLEVQNLLEQGYQPFLSHDGHTLYLAQSPRVLQAGLSFTF